MKSKFGLSLVTFACLFVFAQSSVAEVLSFGIIGDAGMWTNDSKMVRDSIAGAHVQQLILPGDNLYQTNAGYESVWSNWKSQGFLFSVVAIGNHTKGYDAEVKYFNMPAEAYAYSPAPGVKFIVLNSDNVSTVAAQGKFLETELTKGSEPFVFLVYHHPSYTISNFHNWKEKQAFQLTVRQLIWKYRSRLSGLLVGHDHLATLVSLNDLPMIVSGAVWETRTPQPVNYVEGNVTVKTRWMYEQVPYWVRLDISTDKNQFSVSFIRARDSQNMCTAVFAAHAERRMLLQNCFNSVTDE